MGASAEQEVRPLRQYMVTASHSFQHKAQFETHVWKYEGENCKFFNYK